LVATIFAIDDSSVIRSHVARRYPQNLSGYSQSNWQATARLARPGAYALVVHPYIMGAPHRIKYFRRVLEAVRNKKDVKFWTGSQIADWYVAAGPKAP
jgi:allantoinase